MASEYIELVKQVVIALAALAVGGGLAVLGLLLRGPIMKLVDIFKTETAAQTQDVKTIVENSCGPITKDIRGIRSDMTVLATNLLNSSEDAKKAFEQAGKRIDLHDGQLLEVQREVKEHGLDIAKLKSEVAVLSSTGGMRDVDSKKIEGLHDSARG